MRLKRISQVMMVALVALLILAPSAIASGGNNVCPNGVMTKKAFLSCYNNNASARALYNSLGITAGGIKAAKTTKVCAKQGYMSYGRNYTRGSKTVTPDGQRFYKRPLSSVMRGCATAWDVRTKKGSVKVLKFCGNPETKPKKKVKHKKPKKAKKKVSKPSTQPIPGCTNQTGPNTNSGNACQQQQQQSTQTAKVDQECKGPNWNSAQCVVTIYQITNQYQFQVVCGKFVFANGNVVYADNDGNTVTESYCSTQSTTNTIVCTGANNCSSPPPPCDCIPPPLVCPSGSTPSIDGKTCVKDGGTTPQPGPGVPPGPNPPSTGTGSMCKWDHAGTYNGHSHGSGDDVSQADIDYAGGVCPVGSSYM